MIDPDLFGHGDFVSVRAELIREVGAIEAIVLSRIHFRAAETYRHSYEHDGQWWWRAPVDVIADETGLTEKQVRRALTVLRDREYVVAEQHTVDGRYDRAFSYRVAYAYALEGKSEVPQRANVDLPQRANVPTTKNFREEEHQEEASSSSKAGFELFWSLWPRKVGKRTAETAYQRAVRRANTETIHAGAVAYINNPHIPQKEFIPHPTTWLNRDGWEDELPGPSEPTHTATPGRREELRDGIRYVNGKPTIGGPQGMTGEQYDEWRERTAREELASTGLRRVG